MRIDLYKYIHNWLPLSMRHETVIEFLRALCSRLPKAHNDFELYAQKAKYKAKANASVISLEHHIAREFDVKTKITELDGKPTDFLVSIDGYVDEYELSAFIDRWKLAGKSYVFRQGEVKLSASWIDHVCEDIREVWVAKFVDHVCEKERKVYIWAVTMPSEAIPDKTWLIQFTSSSPVLTNITVKVKVTIVDIYTNEIIRTFEAVGVIAKDSNVVVVDTKQSASNDFEATTEILEISPSSDKYYDYIKQDW